MADRSVIQIDFSGGTDERTDKRHVVPGKLISLKNGVFEKGGSIRKRRGYTALSRLTFAGGTLASARELGAFRDELLLDDGSDLYGYGTKWTPKGDMTRVHVERDAMVYSEDDLASADIAYGNGYLVQVWRSRRGGANRGVPYVTLTNVATGGEVFSAFALDAADSAEAIRVAVLGTTAYVFWATGAHDSAVIRARTLDLTAVGVSAWSAPVDIITNSTASNFVRIDTCVLSDRIAIIYTNDGAGDRITVRTFNAALTQLATHTIAGYGIVPHTVGICGATGERIWIVYGDVSGTDQFLALTTLDPSTLAELGTVTLAFVPDVNSTNATIARVDSTHAVAVWYTRPSLATGAAVARYKLVDSTPATVGSGLLWRFGHTSKPFMVGERCYVTMAHLGDAWESGLDKRSDPPTRGVLVELPLASVADQIPIEIARIAPNRVCFDGTFIYSPPSVADIGGGIYATLSSIKGGTATGLDATRFDFGRRDMSPATELGGALHFAAGAPVVYDGAGIVESAFALEANQPYDVQQSSGTGGVENGTYFYVLMFTRHDESGQVYRGEPSIPLEVVVSGGTPTANKVEFRAPCLPLCRDGATAFSAARDLYIKVYRTEAGGETFFELPNVSIRWGTSPAPTAVGPVVNDPEQAFLYVTDQTPDSELAGQPLLYTTGGVLANTLAPSAAIQVVHKGRLWLAGTDDPKIVWFSKQHVFGEGVGFNPLLTVEVDDGGPVTALASLDSHLIIFKRDRIFYVDGDGPPDTGGEGFTPPQRISADLGCIEPRSVAVMPDGLLFQSPAGIYILDRGLGLAYVSGPVEDTLAAYPTITGAVLHESQFHVRFSCIDAEGNGVVLVFDYLAKQWSVFELHETVEDAERAGVMSACNLGGAYVWVASNGAAYTESATNYTDDGVWVTLSLETSWLKVAGLQGWQRAWSMSLLGERFTPHDLVIEVGNDYSDTYHQTKTWSDEDIEDMPLEQIRTAMVRQKCQALRYRISDATPTGGGAVGTGRGLSFTGIAIEAAILRKTKRLGAAQRG